MRRLDIDFTRPGHAPRWAGIVLLLLGVGGIAGTFWQYERAHASSAGTDAILRRARAALKPPLPVELTPVELRKVSGNARRAQDVVALLNVPWSSLFAVLETVNIADSAVLAVESDIEKRRIKISGEARNLKAMLEYTSALEAQSVLGSVQLQNHSTQLQDPQRPVRFVLLADWLDRK